VGEVTGGVSGFYGIPSLQIGNFAIDDEVRFHYMVWGMTLLLCLQERRTQLAGTLSGRCKQRKPKSQPPGCGRPDQYPPGETRYASS